MIELKPLQGLVKDLVEDLHGQVALVDGLLPSLTEEYQGATRAGRVGTTFESWLDGVLDQAAVAWVLGCVFVRFCEDNGLVEKLWIGGPEPEAPVERAVQNRQKYVIDNPLHNDRHWLRTAFAYLAELRATGGLFDRHNPVWRFDISGPAAETLSDFFRRGAGLVSLRTDGLGTRFLGDLYQDLSQHARSTYALLQTPDFVEEFILDRTFEPAVREFGLANTSVIDPTCGSGHFLLGAFDRLQRRWKEREPGTDIRELVERALGQVTGVDINPFAVAIARFRLMVAALNACGLSSLERAPKFPLRVATGDSLLEWGKKSIHQGDMEAAAEGRPAFAFATEDADLLAEYLDQRYTVVVGNPPYITVKDEALNKLYRKLYPKVCYRQYAMTVPFAQRFYELGKRSDENGDSAGWVGQITANSFMKREFGKNLVEKYFAHEIELTEVIDTSGAYIPGHGTPTVILIGRRNDRRRAATVRAVLGIRGEPSQPDVPAEGLVWTEILRNIDTPNVESGWVTIASMSREALARHPWSMSGGGAADLVEKLETKARIRAHVLSIGRTTVLGEDDAWILGDAATVARRGETSFVESFVTGDCVRDFGLRDVMLVRSPYTDKEHSGVVGPASRVVRELWAFRSNLRARVIFGKTLMRQGRYWYEHLENYVSKLATPFSITFAYVSTHNHFVLDRGGKIFNRHAPVIKLAEGASEDDHLRLLGVLNSSTACFWLKQVSHDKGSQSGTGGFMHDEWERFYEFTGTKLEQFPLPERYPLESSREVDGLAQRLATLTPAAVAASGVPTRERLAAARAKYESVRAQMIALQEELDWETYHLYKLTDEPIVAKEAPELKLKTVKFRGFGWCQGLS